MSIERVVRGLIIGAADKWSIADGRTMYMQDVGGAVALYESDDYLFPSSLNSWKVATGAQEQPRTRERSCHVVADKVRGEASVQFLSWAGEAPVAESYSVRLVDTEGASRQAGLEGLSLLQPDYVGHVMQLEVSGEEEFQGALVVRVLAHDDARGPERHQWRLDPFSMMTGGRTFNLLVDPQTGVILRAQKLSTAGVPVETVEWLDLELQ